MRRVQEQDLHPEGCTLLLHTLYIALVLLRIQIGNELSLTEIIGIRTGSCCWDLMIYFSEQMFITCIYI